MDLSPNSPLVKNLFKKRELLQQGSEEHKQIKTALLILGGGMMGVHGIGSAIALHLMGIDEVFDNVIGISTGAGIGAALLAKQTINASHIYYHDIANNKFIKPTRIKKVIDLEYLEKLMREGGRKLDVEKIKSSRSNLYFGVTRVKDAVGEFIDAKTANPGLITAMKASMAVPGLYPKPIKVNDEDYIDGGAALPFPVEEVVKQFAPTDILIISNFPAEHISMQRLEYLVKRFLSITVFKAFPPALRRLLSSDDREKLHESNMRFLATLSEIRVGILWPPMTNLNWLTTDEAKLRPAMVAAIEKTLKTFIGDSEKMLELGIF